MKSTHIGTSKAHTFTAMTYANGQWKQIDETDSHISLSDGKLEIKAGNEPLTITNIRYYNWQQTDAEKHFDAETEITRLPVADDNAKGLIVDLCADYFEENDTLPIIKTSPT